MRRPGRPLRPTLSRHDRVLVHVVGALAAVLLVGGIVVRGSFALSGNAGDAIVTTDERTGTVTSGQVELRGAGATLFDKQLLTPGDRVHRCVELEHRGDLLDQVRVQVVGATGSGAAQHAVHMTIERGRGGDSQCGGFRSMAVVADGALGELSSDQASMGWASWTPTDRTERATYRFTVRLPEQVDSDLQGQRVAADFLWAATAEPTGNNLASLVGALMAEVARDALLPLLVLVLIALLFLVIQDRIDRSDPKLALAAVVEDPVIFLPAHAGAAASAQPAPPVAGSS